MSRQAGPSRDVFISHADPDKDAIARPLAEELRARGHSVWFDEFELDAGDSLKQKIDDGLARSRIGAVILSPSFFARTWANRELEALTKRRIAGDPYALVPVWYGVEEANVRAFSPALADLVAIRADAGVSRIADGIERVLRKAMSTARDELPQDVVEAVNSPSTLDREGVVGELALLLRSRNPRVSVEAEKQLRALTDDRIKRVAAAATTVLDVAPLDSPTQEGPSESGAMQLVG